jgi:hypothetical protein
MYEEKIKDTYFTESKIDYVMLIAVTIGIYLGFILSYYAITSTQFVIV